MSKLKSIAGDDRSATGFFLFGAAAASVFFNVWMASQIYAGEAGIILAFGFLCIEIGAWLILKHILRDWNNGHRIKAAIGGVLFGLMVIACFFMGWRAFEAKNVEIREENRAAMIEADQYAKRADVYFREATAAAAAGNSFLEKKKISEGELARKISNDLKIGVQMRPEVPPEMTVVLLLVFEAIKTLGRWAAATPTAKTPAKIAEEKAIEEARPKRAKAPNRPPEVIAAEKAAKAEKKAAKAAGRTGAPEGLRIVENG